MRPAVQSAQLLKDGEVDMIALWNGRAFTAIKDGANAAFTFNEGIFDFDCLVVPKGAPNKEAALEAFIGKKAELDEMLARLQALSDDHFNCHPDEVGWAMVGTLEPYASLLKRITDGAFGEGEHAR